MNCCPPNPGFTDMMRTKSSLCRTCIEAGQRRRRDQREAALQPRIMDQADGAIDVLARLRVEADDVRPGGERNPE